MDVLVVKFLSSADEGKKALNGFSRKRNFFRVAGNFYLGSSAKYIYSVCFLDFFDIFIKTAEKRNGIFHSFDIN